MATRIEVSRPHDPAEREADRAADAVVQGHAASLSPNGAGIVQRMCDACEAEQDEVHAKRKDHATGGAGPSADPSPLASLDGRGRPLPPRVRAEFEPRFGHDFGDVRLHTESSSADAFDALAYTYGRHVVFGPGHFDPSSARGRHLIAHELAHVVQQASAPSLVQRQKRGTLDDWTFNPGPIPPEIKPEPPDPRAPDNREAKKAVGVNDVRQGIKDATKPNRDVGCPAGWRQATAPGRTGQCCSGPSDNSCCPIARIGFLDHRCCTADEAIESGHCRQVCKPGETRTIMGNCVATPSAKPPTTQPGTSTGTSPSENR